jgi:hypothetical protein
MRSGIDGRGRGGREEPRGRFKGQEGEVRLC